MQLNMNNTFAYVVLGLLVVVQCCDLDYWGGFVASCGSSMVSLWHLLDSSYSSVICLAQNLAKVHQWLCGRVQDLQSGGCGFKSRPQLFAPRSTHPSIPPGSVNEYQLQLGRQRRGACNRQAACQPIAIGWPAYHVVGKRLALVSKSTGQCTKRIFEALFGLRTK